MQLILADLALLSRSDTPTIISLVGNMVLYVICGLIGVGGGIFIAPTLSLFWSTPLKQAVKGSLAIVALQSGAALLGYVGRGVSVSPTSVVGILVLIALGMLVGKRVKAATSDRNLKSYFAGFLILIGIWVLIRP